jgi:hypothetical protein
MLGGVRHRLLAGARQLIDGPRALGEQVEELQSSRARERLAYHCDRLEERVLGSF